MFPCYLVLTSPFICLSLDTINGGHANKGYDGGAIDGTVWEPWAGGIPMPARVSASLNCTLPSSEHFPELRTRTSTERDPLFVLGVN